MKKSGILLIFAMALFVSAFSQNKEKAKNESSIVWLGVDFSVAKLTLVSEDPVVIVDNYYKSINTLIPTEPEKYDIKKFFQKTDVTVNLDMIKEKNSKINPSEIVIDNEYKIDPAEINKIVKNYQLSGLSGTGLVFIAENLNKPVNLASYYVVFFDIASREIIDSRRFEGKAVGIGFRNYWAGSIYNIMKVWLKA